AQSCTHLPPSAYCTATFQPVVLSQALVAIIASLAVYALVFRLTGRRLFACVLASYLSINLYMLAWERSALTETLSYTWLIVVFLCFERFVRRPGLGGGLLLGALIFWAVMIRPSNLFLPVLLFGLLLLRLLWTGLGLRRGASRPAHVREYDVGPREEQERREVQWGEEQRGRRRQQWLPLLAGSSLTGALLLGYMALNGTLNGFFGLSYAHNVTLLGKVIEYHMQDLPVDSQYRTVQTDLGAFISV